MNKKILNLAIPSIVSNITVPLLGLVDVSIVGHLGAPAYIGAIAVGGMLFSMIYWIFVFLRMGTSGLVSQAYGRRDLKETTHIFIRSVAVAMGFGLLLILFQSAILGCAFQFIHTTDDIKDLASLYFKICIWGAPAMLGLYSFAGWYVGMQNSRFPMYIAIAQNVVNILVSLCLVFIFKLGVAGVAFGTLIAQYAGFMMAFFLWLVYYRRLWKSVVWKEVWQHDDFKSFFVLNRDIFFRTLCLVAVTTYFTSQGAGQGEVVLAVNTLLMQLFTIFSYIMDGFAYAAEALTGKYVGSYNVIGLKRMVKTLFVWGFFLSLSFTCVYAIFGRSCLELLTNEQNVLSEASDYFYWTLAIPFAGVSAFLWDGVYIGATASRQMLLSMVVATVAFFVFYAGLHQYLGNHALWLAFIIYLFLRGMVQTFLAKDVLRRAETGFSKNNR